MKTLFLLLFFCPIVVFSQEWPVKSLVANKRAQGVSFEQLSPFRFLNNKGFGNFGTGQRLRMNAGLIVDIVSRRPDAIALRIPLGNRQVIVCDLVKKSLAPVAVTASNRPLTRKITEPVNYIGVIRGENEKNTVGLTVSDDYFSLSIMGGTRSISVFNGKEQDRSVYYLFNSSQITIPEIPMNCGTSEGIASPNQFRLSSTTSSASVNPALSEKCVTVFVDCMDGMYLWQGASVQQTVNMVNDMMNLVAAGFSNDSINVQLVSVNVWDTTDPYRNLQSRDSVLYDLLNYRKDSFWGNIGLGFDYRASGISGIAGGIGKMKSGAPNTCPVYTNSASGPRGALAFADLNYSFSTENFPTLPNVTAAQVYLVMHEMGHLLGSPHTHNCSWKISSNPDVFGALDNCAATEWGCPMGPAPVNGGTIMSYCGGAAGSFINFNNGFGAQPGAKVRDFVRNNTCVSACVYCVSKNKRRDLLPFDLESANMALSDFHCFGPEGKCEEHKGESDPYHCSRK